MEDGDSILLNTSTTALAMVKYITSRNVTIITNNGNIINEENPSHATIVLLGGELRYQKGAMVGDFTKNSLAYVAAKKCFVGCTGISPDIGMVTEMMSEVNLNQMMFLLTPAYFQYFHSLYSSRHILLYYLSNSIQQMK